MGFFNNLYHTAISEFKEARARLAPKPKPFKWADGPNPSAEFPGLNYRNIGTYSFNGEKNLGEAGPMIEYRLDYLGLSTRSWQAMLDSDKMQIGIGRLLKWVLGTGLKPQCEPVESVLKDYGVTLDKKKFAKQVEDRFNLYRKSKSCDYAGMKNLNQLDLEAEKNAMVGGDVLIILRYIKDCVKVQLIDRDNVVSPEYGNEYFPQALSNGNTIVDGVEINSKREHVAFYVRIYSLDSDIGNLFKYKFERIEAKSKKTGLTMAYLYYGAEHRINNTRGIPIVSACIEKLKNMEEYSDATLNQAKEAAKVDYQVIHDLNADGKAPWAKSTVQGFNSGMTGAGPGSNLPTTDDGIQLKKTVHITDIGTAYNNQPGSRLEMLKNENPLYFDAFMNHHVNVFCAVIDLPPNVFWGLYTDSFSASRASVVDLIHTLLNKREHHYVGHKKPIFDLWLHTEILKGNIQAPGYLLALSDGNEMVLEAYRGVRFVGRNPGHIDPEKEANAARVVLGKAFENVPLNDLESMTEQLGFGNAIENIQQAAQELGLSNSLGIKPLPIEQKVVNDSTITKGKKKKSGKAAAKFSNNGHVSVN